MSASAMNDSRVTIFTGVPRSGTTMLGRLAKNYLDVAIVNEGPFEFWLADQFRTDEIPQDDLQFSRVLDRLVKHLYFQILLSSKKAQAAQVTAKAAKERLLALTQPRTLQGLGLAVLRYTSEVLELPRLGHEDPMLIFDLPKLFRIFPQARIVHIIRDPRDVATSILQYPWGANNVVVAGLNWGRLVRQTRQLGRELGKERYLEIHYRNLLQNPREEMAALMSFVCGRVDEQRLEAYVAETQKNPLRNNIDTWRDRLTAKQLALVEGACGEEMIEFGFARETAAPRLSLADRLFWQAHDRVLRLQRIFRGRLTLDGSAIFETGPDPILLEKIQKLNRTAKTSDSTGQ